MHRPSLLLLTAALFACGGDPAPTPDPGTGAGDAPAGPRTVVLVSLDTLRAERLGLYGGRDGVSPTLDALAGEAAVFDQALSPTPWTLPSHMTMLTGLDPIAHGVINESRTINPDVVTLAESLRDAGYATGAFTDGGYVMAKFGFDQGFDTFDDQRTHPDSGKPNGFPRLMPRALEWLQTRERDEDVFLFLHTFDAHTPYDEVAEDILETFRERPVEEDPRDARLHWASHLYKQDKVGVTDYDTLGELLNDYDAGVHEADLHLGQLFEVLRGLQRWDDALIVVTSDHGESFFDHGLHVGHGLLLTDAELHIPMIVKLPGGEGAGDRHEELVSLVDVMPTILDASDVAAPADIQGESLLGLIRGQPRRTRHLLGASSNMRAWSLIQDGYKYVTPVSIRPLSIAQRHLGPMTPSCFVPTPEDHLSAVDIDGRSVTYDVVGDPLGLRDVIPGAEQLFDRAADPGELHDLAAEDPQRLAALRRSYSQLSDASRRIQERLPAGTTQLDPAEQRMMKMLGYLESGEREDMRGLPPAMLEWVTDPHVAPETARLDDADRRVHRVRVRLADGAEPSAADHADLEAAGEQYLDWLADHPEHLVRVDWRVFELDRLARSAGLQLSGLSEWLQTMRDQ